MIVLKAWEEIWKKEEEHALWLEPDPFVIALVPLFHKEGIVKILDIGFGLGRHAILLTNERFDVYGIETSLTGLEYAIKWSKKEEMALKLIIGEMAHLPFNDSSFDLIVTWNVLYHGTTNYIQKTIKEIERCLRMDGYLLCTLISTKHTKYDLGEEIERNTFVIAEENEKSHPHHYFSLKEIDEFFHEFILLKCVDLEQYNAGCFHWHVLAKLTSNYKE